MRSWSILAWFVLVCLQVLAMESKSQQVSTTGQERSDAKVVVDSGTACSTVISHPLEQLKEKDEPDAWTSAKEPNDIIKSQPALPQVPSINTKLLHKSSRILFQYIQLIAPGFWNIQIPFKVLGGFADVGAQMSILSLPNGKLLIIDTVPLYDCIRYELDMLTNYGQDIEAVIMPHPFHTTYVGSFYKAYPQADYYGTPRHLRTMATIPWKGDLNEQAIRMKWAPYVLMSIPAGAEFVNPMPERLNHFSSVVIFHVSSKTVHVDDTFNYYSGKPNFFMRRLGFKANTITLHGSLTTVGLHPTRQAPLDFKEWMAQILNEWDFVNMVFAHKGVIVKDAKKRLQECYLGAIPVLTRLSRKYAHCCY